MPSHPDWKKHFESIATNEDMVAHDMREEAHTLRSGAIDAQDSDVASLRAIRNRALKLDSEAHEHGRRARRYRSSARSNFSPD